jgi:hypothetical protein
VKTAFLILTVMLSANLWAGETRTLSADYSKAAQRALSSIGSDDLSEYRRGRTTDLIDEARMAQSNLAESDTTLNLVIFSTKHNLRLQIWTLQPNDENTMALAKDKACFQAWMKNIKALDGNFPSECKK